MYSIINALFHLIGFGIIFTSFLGGCIIEKRIRNEKEWNQKLFLGKISSRFSFLFLLASITLFITGFINILSIYGGKINLFYTEGWLIAKIILFAFLLINGTVLGPILFRRRTKLTQEMPEKKPDEEAETNLKVLNKSITKFYLVQFILLLIILFLSIIGAEKN
ncbi:MAG: CopD family protein [Bacteroidetes bacterium]|nr:CopD family protein [Bacteroidota bacterium]